MSFRNRETEKLEFDTQLPFSFPLYQMNFKLGFSDLLLKTSNVFSDKVVAIGQCVLYSVD